MSDVVPVYATAAIIGTLVLANVFRKGFDPFAPIWLFVIGYAQVYVLQMLTYRDWALRVHGDEVVYWANIRALWAIVWFLLVYYSGLGRRLARRLTRPPAHWSTATVGTIAPFMLLWGLMCAGLAFRQTEEETSGIEGILRAMPFVFQLAGILLLVTGRQLDRPRPGWTAAGIAISIAYVLIWMFNGKRSHAIYGVLTGVAAFYIPRYRRPSKPVLAVVGVACAAAVALAIGWRDNFNYDRSFAGFIAYLGDFEPSRILTNTKLAGGSDDESGIGAYESHETEEVGGYLLMMHTVPEKAGYDYGAPYNRLWSTFIPRQIFWSEKPLFGRDKWKEAWIAGSEFPRDMTFTGPAISLLGATQLNGGATGTAIVMAVLAILLRTAYEYFRLHGGNVWVQCWWAASFYNSWLMIVNDDPAVWFYYNYGFTTFVPLSALWIWLKILSNTHQAESPSRPAVVWT
jgi:hypothetical protein